MAKSIFFKTKLSIDFHSLAKLSKELERKSTEVKTKGSVSKQNEILTVQSILKRVDGFFAITNIIFRHRQFLEKFYFVDTRLRLSPLKINQSLLKLRSFDGKIY